MMHVKLTAEQRLQKAVIDIMAHPRYMALSGVMLVGKVTVRDDIPTACTNGRDEFYGRAFVDSLSDKELRFLKLHEVYHKMYKHLTGLQHLFKLDAGTANQACVVGETRVTMADGSFRSAENICVGDMVSTPFGPSPVLAVKVTDNREVCELDIDYDNKLYCTPDHKILTERGYVEAQHITEAEAGYVDTRNGQVHTGQPRNYAGKGHGAYAGGHTNGSISPRKEVGIGRVAAVGEAEVTAQLGALVAYGLGVLRGLGGRGGYRNMSASSGKISTPHTFRDEHKLQLDALVRVSGHVLCVGQERPRKSVLAGGGKWLWYSPRAGRYQAMGEDTYEAVRHTHGDNPHTAGAWVSFPPDTAHHRAIAGVEGFEHARLAVRRLAGSRRRVYDITTSAQCFIAEGLVVHNCDYVINTQLVEENKGDKFATMTGPLTIGCYDLKYKGWDSVSVFRDLRKNAEESGGGKGSSGGEGFDQHDWEDAEALDPEERRQLEREIDEAVRQGVLAASKLGTGGSRDFGDLLQPQQDWREVLREFVQTTCTGHDYSTWRRPNRRYVASGMYMPSGISETIGEIVIAPDMSGSIGAREINRMLSETKAIAQIVKPEAVRLLYWDTKICADERYVQAELDSLVDSTKPAGGGGTMVECVPEHITAEQIKAQCAVVFTDGYLGGTWGEWPCPVLWVIVDNKNCHPPFGTVLHVTARDF
jgi:predicted metal-dependent peptidase